MKTKLIITLLILSSCNLKKQALTLIPINQPFSEEEVHLPEKQERHNATFVYDNSPEIKAALKEFAETGKAPIVKKAGFVQFPYGEVQPVLNCQTDRGCDIELQPGEKVRAVILGNEHLWDYLVWESNQETNPVTHVTIGPRVSSSRTNAIIGTNRRTYHLELLSTKKSDYIRSAKYYYPRERLKRYQIAQRKKDLSKAKNKKRKERNKLIEKIADSGGLPYEYLNFDWDVKAKKSIAWKPSRVFDDGAHIYLQFPKHVSFENFPGLYIPTKNGLRQPVWRAVRSETKNNTNYIMVDGIFNELRLVGGFSDEKEVVTISRKK